MDFWSKVTPPDSDGHRLWTGAKAGRYGLAWREGRRTGAHRRAWELTHGPIPPGLCVCHTCDVPLCCEPSHLFLGTYADNMRDAVAKGRTARGQRHGAHTKPDTVRRGAANGMAKLTEADVAEIRASSESERALARRFGVDQTTIGRARRGRTWR